MSKLLIVDSIFQELGFFTVHTALLLSTTPSTFDLFLALYPISRASNSPLDRIRYSNDCKYLAGVAQDLQKLSEDQHDARIQEPSSLKAHFEESSQRLITIASTSLDDSIVGLIPFSKVSISLTQRIGRGDPGTPERTRRNG
jgi:hypothetical protein